MSLLLELDIPGLDWALAERLVAETERANLLSVYGIPKRSWLRGKPRLNISDVADDGTEVFDDDPQNDAAITPACRERLAQTLLTLAELLAPGWEIHIGWVGEGKCRQEVSAAELADVARQSRFESEVRYRVV